MLKKLILIIILLQIMTPLCAENLTDLDLDGYYDISNCTELQMIKNDLVVNYELIKDINCSDTVNWNFLAEYCSAGEFSNKQECEREGHIWYEGTNLGFEPIGVDTNSFTGNLNGNNFTISDIWISRNLDKSGIFFEIENSNIFNLKIINSNIINNYTNSQTGILAGNLTDVNLSNILITGDINCNLGYCGGFSATGQNVTINDSNFQGNISSYSGSGLIQYVSLGEFNNINVSADINCNGTGYCGGLVATAYTLNIYNSEFNGNIYSLGNKVGGLIGNTCLTEIDTSQVLANITGNKKIGGLIGAVDERCTQEIYIIKSNFSGTINSTFSTFGESSSIGGLIGVLNCSEHDCTIDQSYVTGEINSVTSDIGGLIGLTLDDLNISNSYVNANILSQENVSGFIGNQFGNLTISNSYYTGNLSGPIKISGLVNIDDSATGTTIVDSFVITDIADLEQEDGIIFISGILDPTIENVWWYNESSRVNYFDVTVDGINKANSYSDFYSDSNTEIFSDWYRNIWYFLEDDYPILAWQVGGDTDGDGETDNTDTLLFTETEVTIIGLLGDLNVLVGGEGTDRLFSGEEEVVFYDGNIPLMSFDFNFDTAILDLNRIAIEKTENSVVVNLDGQLQDAYNKTIYIQNNNFSELCVKDVAITSVSEITDNCSEQGEYNFTNCLINGSYSESGIYCLFDGTTLTISGLRHSGILGKQKRSSGGRRIFPIILIDNNSEIIDKNSAIDSNISNSSDLESYLPEQSKIDNNSGKSMDPNIEYSTSPEFEPIKQEESEISESITNENSRINKIYYIIISILVIIGLFYIFKNIKK